MTLRDFLKKYCIKLSQKEESDLGVIISKKYISVNDSRCLKVKRNYNPTPVNDYPELFLDSITDFITDELLKINAQKIH